MSVHYVTNLVVATFYRLFCTSLMCVHAYSILSIHTETSLIWLDCEDLVLHQGLDIPLCVCPWIYSSLPIHTVICTNITNNIIIIMFEAINTEVIMITISN